MALRNSFSDLQYNCAVIVVLLCLNYTVFLRTVIISLIVDRQRTLELFGLFGEFVWTYFSDCSLVSSFTNERQFSLHVTRRTLLRNFKPSFVVSLQKSANLRILYVLWTPWVFSRSILPNFCDNFVENSAWQFDWNFNLSSENVVTVALKLIWPYWRTFQLKA